jgi:hypothetical protein
MIFKMATSRLKLIATIAVGLLIFSQSFAQKTSGNRLDACIQRNRKLTQDINTLNQIVSRQSNQIVSNEGMVNYYQGTLKAARDSSQSTQKAYDELVTKSKNQIEELAKELAATRAEYEAFKDELAKNKQRIVKDTNVVRVYNLPYDQVRVRVLRKVLDEGIGLVIERNTDEGFLVSKVFKDRKSKGNHGKALETRVDCDIKMIQHPYEESKTLFYAVTRVQEKQKKGYIELTDDILVRDYQKKLLKFFDDFLVSN